VELIHVENERAKRDKKYPCSVIWLNLEVIPYLKNVMSFFVVLPVADYVFEKMLEGGVWHRTLCGAVGEI